MFLTSGGTLPHLQEKNVLKRLVLDNPDCWLLLFLLSRGSKGFTPCQKTTYRSPRLRTGVSIPVEREPCLMNNRRFRSKLESKRKSLQYPLFRNNSYNRIPVGFNPWWKRGEMSFFFSLSCLFPTGLTGETQDGSLGTRDKGYCCLVLFSSSAFFGSEAPDPPLGERGGQKGEWASANESTYFSLG